MNDVAIDGEFADERVHLLQGERERFLVLMREWAGRGAGLDDPYDPALVRSAPREIRHLLADALAEEATARAVSSLGIGYTIWSNVEADRGSFTASDQTYRRAWHNLLAEGSVVRISSASID